MKKETFNSKRGLKEVQLKDPNTCENYKEIGCVKDVCDCYTLVSKEEPSTRLKNSLKQFNISLEEALGMEDFRLKNIGFSKRSILEIDLFRGEPKQETLEEVAERLYKKGEEAHNKGKRQKEQIHGTLYSYNSYKCKCDLCKKANTDYCRNKSKTNNN